MKYIIFVLIGLLAALVAVAVYVRVAPSKAALWHNPNVPVMGPGEYLADGAHLSQRPIEGDGFAQLAALDAIVRATARTSVLAGSVEDAKITYITRSRVFGFPDYTTVTLMQLPSTGMSTVQIYSRLRLGKFDMGVNRFRIENWISQWQPVRDAQ
jgi:hypothetical protein